LGCGTIAAQGAADNSDGLSVNVANAAVRHYYIAPTGRDSNGGSATHPWATIGHAGMVIGPGAIVHVAPGTYTGYIDTRASGTSSSRITYISDAQWGAKIVGNRVDHSTWHNYGNYVDIIGFELTSVGRMGLYNDGSFVRYMGNHVHDIAGPTSAMCDMGGAGIMHGNYSAARDEMIGNVVHDIGLINSAQCPGYVTVHGLYLANRRGRIIDNLVIRARDYGIHLYHSATDVIVANNTSLQNGASGLVVGNSGGGADNNTLVTNNIFAYNQKYGFRDDSGNANLVADLDAIVADIEETEAVRQTGGDRQIDCRRDERGIRWREGSADSPRENPTAVSSAIRLYDRDLVFREAVQSRREASICRGDDGHRFAC